MEPSKSDTAVKEATGRPWADWFALLDTAGARDWTHKQIVEWLLSSGNLTRSWWGQMVTVEYERHIGRRATGQRCTGDWTANVSRTLPVDLDTALARWQKAVAGQTEFNGMPIDGEPRISATEKWRYWRASFADGSTVSANIGAKGEGRTAIAIDHGKIGDEESAAAWKAFWKTVSAGI